MRLPSFWFLLWLGNEDSPRETEILKSPVNCLTLPPTAFCVRKKKFLGNLWVASVLVFVPGHSLWLWPSDESVRTLQGELGSLHAVNAVSPEVLGSLWFISGKLFSIKMLGLRGRRGAARVQRNGYFPLLRAELCLLHILCWSSSPEYLSLWLYLKIGPLKIWLS